MDKMISQNSQGKIKKPFLCLRVKWAKLLYLKFEKVNCKKHLVSACCKTRWIGLVFLFWACPTLMLVGGSTKSCLPFQNSQRWLRMKWFYLFLKYSRKPSHYFNPIITYNRTTKNKNTRELLLLFSSAKS